MREITYTTYAYSKKEFYTVNIICMYIFSINVLKIWFVLSIEFKEKIIKFWKSNTITPEKYRYPPYDNKK